MTRDTQKAIAVASGVAQRVSWACDEAEGTGPTLLALWDIVESVDATRDELRGALAYLAAQLYAARRSGDAARGSDAQHALRVIEEQVAWFKARHGG